MSGGIDRTLLVLTLSALTAAAWGQPLPELAAHRAATPPKIDGDLGDPVWQAAPKTGPFVDPFTGRETADRTYAWLAFDGEAIYVAIQCLESQMGQLVAREVVPGSKMESDDRVSFSIDPFNTKTMAGMSSFVVNPAANQTEVIAGGRSAKREWRGVWQAAIKRHADSWTVEMRIPWRMLTYGAGGGRDMAVNFERYQARTSITSQWANQGPNERPDIHGHWKGVQPPPPPAAQLETMPYVAPEWNDNEFNLRAGVDVRYRLNERLTGVASLKPDFRNIEGQIAGIDFQRSERFLEDNRPFFAEGGGFFDMTSMFSFGRMFYSRRIEDFDFGAKVFGSVNDRLRVGALATTDGGDRRNAVFRFQQLTGRRSSAALFGTLSERPGERNRMVGTNVTQWLGNYSANFQAAIEGEEGNDDSGGSASLDYGVPKFFSQFRYTWVDPGFQPALALVPFDDHKGWYLYTEHNNDYRSGPLKNLHAEVFVDQYRHFDGSSQEKGYSLGLEGVTRSDHNFELFYNDFEFDGVPDKTWWIEAGVNASNRFKQFSVAMEGGRRENEDTRFLSFEGRYRAIRRVDLGLERSMLDFMGKTNQTIFTLSWEIDRARSISGRYVELNGKRNYYAAFRNAGFSGMELYVVLGDPNAESFKKRISVKLVWAL